MADIFISYSREDKDWAAKLANAFEQRSWSVFWDVHIPIGERFDRIIKQELDAARCIVVLWSRTSVDSDWVLIEAAEGRRRNALFPVRLEEVDPPLEFRRLQAAELGDWKPGAVHAGFESLIHRLLSKLPDREAPLRPASPLRPANGRIPSARTPKRRVPRYYLTGALAIGVVTTLGLLTRAYTSTQMFDRVAAIFRRSASPRITEPQAATASTISPIIVRGPPPESKTLTWGEPKVVIAKRRSEEEAVKQILDWNKRAVDAYLRLDFWESEGYLKSAHQLSVLNDVQSEVADIMVNRGALSLVGFQRRDEAREFFNRALSTEPGVQLPPLLATPFVQQLFNEVVALRRGLPPPPAPPEGIPCFLTVNSVPWSEFWIDGENTLWHTPVVDYPVVCGQRHLTFRRSDLAIDQTEIVTLTPGRRLKQRYQLAARH